MSRCWKPIEDDRPEEGAIFEDPDYGMEAELPGKCGETVHQPCFLVKNLELDDVYLPFSWLTKAQLWLTQAVRIRRRRRQRKYKP